VVGALDLRNYVGLDQSPQSLAMARARRPDWTFLKAPAESVEPADFVVCFEVLIHQSSFADYRALVDFIACSTVRCLVLSGYDRVGDHFAFNHLLYSTIRCSKASKPPVVSRQSGRLVPIPMLLFIGAMWAEPSQPLCHGAGLPDRACVDSLWRRTGRAGIGAQ
jgi:hypothetical protein